MAGLYIHIPFCASKCSYCDFYSCTSLGARESFIDALVREMSARRDFLSGEPVRTLYLGGGTPSLLTPAQLSHILDEAAANFDLRPEEITTEANPDDLTPQYIEALAQTGIDRLSIGVQSFDKAHLRLMNRRHTGEQAAKAIADAQKAGFDNISADLIFGIPGMSVRQWRDNIERMVSLGVQHISAYHLSIEEGTPFAAMARRGEIAPAEEEANEEQYRLLREALTAAGFEHYEISNFALPGYRARHNSSYWQGVPYLGLGPSAHSYDGSRRQWCTADAERYIAQSPSAKLFHTERLSPEDLYNEYVMVRLRCAGGVELADLERKFGNEAAEKFVRDTKIFISGGKMQNKEGHISVLPESFLISDRIISHLFNV